MLDGEKPDEVWEELKCIVESLRIFDYSTYPGGSRSIIAAPEKRLPRLPTFGLVGSALLHFLRLLRRLPPRTLVRFQRI